MPSSLKLLATGALVALVASLFPADRAHAQTSFTSAFSPIRVNAKPGDVVTTHVNMTLGPGSRTIHFRAHMEDWWRTADGLKTFYRPAGTLRRSCGQWVSLDPAEQAVPPEGHLKVRLTINVPRDIGPGGYWCAVTIDEQADPLYVAKQTGIAFKASFSTGVYVYIAPLERDAVITDLRIDGDHVQVAVRGKGNTPMPVSGTVELRRPGQDALVATITLDKGVLLPEPVGATVIHGKLPDDATVPTGQYVARGIIDVGMPHYLGAEKALQVTRATPRPRSHVARTLFALALCLGTTTPSAWGASPPDAWTLAVAGGDVPAARPERRDGVMTIDLVAVGARVGLTVTVDAGVVTVRGTGAAEWTAADGDVFFNGLTRQVFLERPLELTGGAAIVSLEAVATMSGYFATIVPAERRVDLVPPAAPTATFFSLAKPPEELAKMRDEEADGMPHGRRPDMRLTPPHAYGTMRLRAGVSYVLGEDGAMMLGADGDYYGVHTNLDASMTLGERGLELLSGRVRLLDEELGWSLSAGDLPSRLFGSARGLRTSYRIVDGWQPVLTAYLPWRRGPNEDLLVSWAEHLAFSDTVSLDTELATDTSLSAQLTYRGASWSVAGSFVRRNHRLLGMRHEAGLYGHVRVSSDVSMAARVSAINPDTPDGAIRAQLSIGWPLLAGLFPNLRATLRHGSVMTSRTWSHVEHLALRLRLGPVSGRLAYQLRMRQPNDPNDAMVMNHDGGAGVNVRLGSRLNVDVQVDGGLRPDGTIAGRGTARVVARPFESTTLELAATYPTTQVQARVRQELPEGFSLAAEYGGVAPFQPILGAEVDPHLVRLTLTRAWNVHPPARGGTVSGTLRDRQGNPVSGAVVQLGRFRVATDATGSFSFSPLEHGKYYLEVDAASLPVDYAMTDGRRLVEIDSASDSVYYELSADRYANIRGVVYQDLNGNATYDPGEGLPGAPVRLGERTTAPGPDGHFTFYNVLPGTHVVRLAALYIADGYQADGPIEIEAVVGDAGEPSELVTFRIGKKQRPIIFNQLPAEGLDHLYEK